MGSGLAIRHFVEQERAVSAPKEAMVSPIGRNL